MTRDFLGLRMRNFQGIVFIWTQTYSKTFKSALVYFETYISVILNEIKKMNSFLWVVSKKIYMNMNMQVSEIETK